MGAKEVHASAARQESGMSSYKIVWFPTALWDACDARNFVIAHFLRSLRHENDFYRLVDPPAYYEAYGKYITDKLFKDPSCTVRLAVLVDDPDVILGFSLHREDVLDYIFVLRDQRMLGIATKLVPPGITTISHLTKKGLSIWGSKYGDWKFNPFA